MGLKINIQNYLVLGSLLNIFASFRKKLLIWFGLPKQGFDFTNKIKSKQIMINFPLF
jgi:hypothetical protein